jgi:hypothetical protein
MSATPPNFPYMVSATPTVAFTPAMTWHGVGKLQSTSGANYALFIEVNLYVRPRRHSSIAGTDNLTGTAKLRTREGEIYPLTVSGYIKRVGQIEGR